MGIGKRLKDIRCQKGLTQEELAKRLGVSRQTICNWENERSTPDIVSAIKLGNIYDMSLDTLLNGEAVIKHFENIVQKRRRFWQAVLELSVILELLGQLLEGLEFAGLGGVLSWAGLLSITISLVMHLSVFDHSRNQTIRGMTGLATHWTMILGAAFFPEFLAGIPAVLVQSVAAILIWSAGVWTVNWKSPRLWLIFALFLGTPLLLLGKGMQKSGILVENTPFPGRYRVAQVLYPQEDDRYRNSVVQLGENSLTLFMDGVTQDYIGVFTYCEPNLEDTEEGIWLLTPKDRETETYRLTLEPEDSLTLSFTEGGQLQWKWKLKEDHRQASITIPTFGHTTSKGLTWYPEDSVAEDPIPSFRNSIDVVLNGRLNLRVAGMNDISLTLHEEYHHGNEVDHKTYILEPDKKGRYSMAVRVRYKGTDDQFALYRIPFENGEYRFTVTFAGIG